jgi:hypothetical protein
MDYRTAKYTGAQDKLIPMHEIQLNVYALIGEPCGYWQYPLGHSLRVTKSLLHY